MEATVNGVRMHWREVGQGQAVLFVHGFPFHSGMWEEQLARLPRRWRLIAPDLRGFGKTELGGKAGPLGMDLLADDLARLLDSLAIDRAVVVGLSMGGYIAFQLWAWHPQRVRALVLCNTRAGPDTEAGRRGRQELAERVREQGTKAVVETLLPKLTSERTQRERPEVVERVREMMESTPPETIAAASLGMAERPDSTELLPTIEVPTLVVAGGEDAVASLAEAELMAKEIPDARLVVIEGTGHLTPMEDPVAFNRALVHFLEAIEGH